MKIMGWGYDSVDRLFATNAGNPGFNNQLCTNPAWWYILAIIGGNATNQIWIKENNVQGHHHIHGKLKLSALDTWNPTLPKKKERKKDKQTTITTNPDKTLNIQYVVSLLIT